jgi:superfamily II DNA/RNA helicase
MHSRRDRAASLLLATPSASRGLDLPAVSHVYNLGPPADAREYLHRAGRAGRIGSTTGGLVTSIVTRSELERLCEITAELGIALAVETEAAQGLGLVEGGEAGEGMSEGDLEARRRRLDDIYRLL